MPRYIDADAIHYVEIGKGVEIALASDIDKMPTISPDEVRGVGEWIWHDKYGWDDSLECSCCAEEFVVYDGEFPGIDSFKFCPNCGAKMKGAEDGTTYAE